MPTCQTPTTGVTIFPDIPEHGKILVWIILLLAILGSLILSFLYLKSKVTIKDGCFDYFDGGKNHYTGNLHDIREVRLVRRNIVITLNSERNVDIPLQFQDNPKLLAMLRYYRPRLS